MITLVLLTGIDIRNHLQPTYVDRRNSLQPYGLPDSCCGCVPDAARLRAAAGGVPDGYKYLLPVTRHCCGSDIESKGIVSTPVLSGLSSVDPDDTLPVNSPEMPR